MSNLSDLAVKISLDLADMKKGVGDANKELQKISKQAENSSKKISTGMDKLKSAAKVGAIAAGVTVAVGAAAAKIADFTIEALRMADAIGDTAQSLGMGAEAFQAMEFATGMAGIKSEKFVAMMRMMNEQVGKALSGDKTAKKLFDDIGVSIDDLIGKNPDEVFKILTNGLAGISNSQIQAAASARIFGAKNNAVLNIVREGTEAYEANIQKAHELGFVISNEVVAAADKAIDSLDGLSKSLGVNAKVAFIQHFKPAVELAIGVMEKLNRRFAEFNRRTADVANLTTVEKDMEEERLTKSIEEGAARYARALDEIYREGSSHNDRWVRLYQEDMQRLKELQASKAKDQEEANEAEKVRAEETAADMARIASESEAAALKATAEKMTESNRSTEQKYNDGLAIAQAAFDAGLISQYTFNEEKKKLDEARIKQMTADFAEADRLRQQDLTNINAYHAQQLDDADFRSEQAGAPEADFSDGAHDWLDAVEAKKFAQEGAIELQKQYIEFLRETGIEEERLLLLQEDLAEQMATTFGTPTQKLMNEWGDLLGGLEAATTQWLEGGADQMAEFLTSGKANFNDFAKQIMSDIMKMVVRAMLFNAITGMSKMGGGMGAFGKFLGGGGTGKAGGGTIQPGVATPVGERGTEMIVPNAPMRVLNNHVSKQMGKSDVRVEVVNRGTPAQATNTNVNFDAKGMIIQVVMDDLQRGGKLASGMNGLYGLRRKTN